MDLLSITIGCINLLAWPMLALGYPLFVTIRAIEAGCVYDKRKVGTYWQIFSLIYLLEHIFAKFLEWVPLWSYLRLVFMCWLVIPQLNGAFYLYQNLVHPYLQFKLPNAITQLSEWLKKLKKHSVSINKETFLAVAESCLDENDSLIASKPECNEGGQILGDIQEMECTAKCNAVESNQIENISISAIQVISKPVIPTVAILPDTSSLAVFQTRWTCEICQVTVSSELTLQSHLRGRKHRAEAMLWCTFCNLRVSGGIVMIAHLKGKSHLAKLQETFTNSGVIPAVAILPDTSSLAVFQTRWTCEICQVTVRSELTLQSHLRGRKHRAEDMLWCTFCNLRVSGEIDMIAHLKGKRHLAKLQETFTNSGAS